MFQKECVVCMCVCVIHNKYITFKKRICVFKNECVCVCLYVLCIEVYISIYRLCMFLENKYITLFIFLNNVKCFEFCINVSILEK